MLFDFYKVIVLALQSKGIFLWSIKMELALKIKFEGFFQVQVKGETRAGR